MMMIEQLYSGLETVFLVKGRIIPAQTAGNILEGG